MTGLTAAVRAAARSRTGSFSSLALATAVAAIPVTVALALVETGRGITPPFVVVDLVGVVLPVGLGALRLAHDQEDRFARALVGAGLVWSLATLAQSGNSFLYSTGRVAYWFSELALVYLLLSFPDGRLKDLRARRLMTALVVLLVTLYLPTAFAGEYPVPSPLASCGIHCPANAFSATSSTPALVADVINPGREVLTILLYSLVAALITERARARGALTRRSTAPVAAAAIVRVVALAVFFGARGTASANGAAGTLGRIYLYSLPAISLCFGFGLLLRRLFVADALQRLAEDLKPHVSPRGLRRALAHALRDPRLEVVYWAEGGAGHWVDEDGWPADLPGERATRASTEIGDDGRLRAAIVHDADLVEEHDVVAAACAYALTALENERLVEELNESLRKLSESRARVVAVVDSEHRRIERDLHDGAQQRLVALRVKLAMLADRAGVEAPAVAEALELLEDDVDAAIDDVRAFARGIYPPLLTQRGLAEALRAAGRAAPVPTIVDASGISRYPPEVESTVYFACMEALQNASKHAKGLSGVVLSVKESDELCFTVHDDGAGFDPASVEEGVGLTHLRDRMDALGGTLEIASSPGHGTSVTGRVSSSLRLSPSATWPA